VSFPGRFLFVGNAVEFLLFPFLQIPVERAAELVLFGSELFRPFWEGLVNVPSFFSSVRVSFEMEQNSRTRLRDGCPGSPRSCSALLQLFRVLESGRLPSFGMHFP